MAGVLITGIAVRNLNNTGPTKMKWSEIYPSANWSIEEACDYTTLDSSPSQIEFVDEGILLCWVEPFDEGITDIQRTPSSYHSNAALLILFYPVKDREDGEAGSCWTAKLIHCKLQGQGTLQGKGQPGQGGKRNGADGRVHELGGMKWQNVLPKQVRSSWEAENAQSPQPTTESASFSILGKFHFIKHSPFQLGKKRLGFAYSTSSYRECNWSPPSYKVKDAVDRFQETINYSSPNDTSLVVVPLPPSCISKWDFAHCFNSVALPKLHLQMSLSKVLQ